MNLIAGGLYSLYRRSPHAEQIIGLVSIDFNCTSILCLFLHLNMKTGIIQEVSQFPSEAHHNIPKDSEVLLSLVLQVLLFDSITQLLP